MTGIRGVVKKRSHPRAGMTISRRSMVQPKDVTKPKATEKPFDFFGLLRELRDLVYKELLADMPERYTMVLTSSHLNARELIDKNLLLVNHQFSDEYQDAEKACATFVVGPVPQYATHPRQMPELNYLWARVSQLHLIAVMEIGDIEPLVDGAYLNLQINIRTACDKWMHFTGQALDMLPRLRHFQVTAVVCGESEILAPGSRLIRGFWKLKNIPRLDVLELCDYSDRDEGQTIESETGYVDATRIMYKWTALNPTLRRLGDNDRTVDGKVKAAQPVVLRSLINPLQAIPVQPWMDDPTAFYSRTYPRRPIQRHGMSLRSSKT